MVSARNFGARGRESIGFIKSMLEVACPLTVSCADIIALAARETVAASGGPHIRVPLGKRDAISSSYSLADASLPSADTGVDGMLQILLFSTFIIARSALETVSIRLDGQDRAAMIPVDGRGLSYDFYERSCPQVEMLVQQGLGSVFISDPTTPAALLRLLFHDCQVQGCDASILLDDNGGNRSSEIVSARNFGVRGRESIGMIKSILEVACPLTVSCADIIALAAREAVAASGGPHIRVPLGRRDAVSSSYSLADASLPSADTGVDGMLQIFAAKGMSVEESVAILGIPLTNFDNVLINADNVLIFPNAFSGAHTIGITHCINIIDQQHKPESPKVNFKMR
ncbi:hypothetical protein ACLOJK_026544 [Asimina triloba]